MTKRVRGVALIVVNPSGKIIILQEFTAKPDLGKQAGMLSIPMETINDGENILEALLRLINEELPGLQPSSFPQYIGAYRLAPRTWAFLHLMTVDTDRLPETACHSEEVGNHRWMEPERAMELWLRRGAYEMIEDYRNGFQGVVRSNCADRKNPSVRA